MPFADSQNTSLYYEDHGQGEPVLLITGLGGTVMTWGLQIPEFSKRFRVLAMDNRGAGLSDKPDAPYSMQQMAGDALSVLDAAGVDAAHVVAVSMGGFIAQELYHLAPERVRSLVLGCTGIGMGDPEVVRATDSVVELIQRDRYQTTVEDMLAEMVPVFYHPEFIERVPDLVEKLLKYERDNPQPPHAYHRQAQAVLSYSGDPEKQARIEAPALFLHGDADLVWPPENGRILAGRMPNARFELLRGAGHMLMIEQPRTFNARVVDFLADHGENGAAQGRRTGW